MDFAFVRFREEVPPPLEKAAIGLISRRRVSNQLLSVLKVPEGLKDTQYGVEQVADEIRRMLGVYRGPIYDPALAADDAGVEVYDWSYPRSNSAVSVRFGYAIFRSEISTSYDIMFEFTSIVLNGMSYGKGVSMKDEAFARKVAGAVLLPKSEIQRELGTNRPLGYLDERVVAYFSVKYNLDTEVTIRRLIAAGAVLPMVADLADLGKAKELARTLGRENARRSYLMEAISGDLLTR